MSGFALHAATAAVCMAVPILTLCTVNAYRAPNEEVIPAQMGSESNESDRSSRCRQLVEGWLGSQQKGRDGFGYWSKDVWVRPIRLYAVRSWEIVDVSENLRDFVVRIESSSKAGSPLVKLWKVSIIDTHTDAPTILYVREAQ